MLLHQLLGFGDSGFADTPRTAGIYTFISIFFLYYKKYIYFPFISVNRCVT